jgi:YHS domain-containing protein
LIPYYSPERRVKIKNGGSSMAELKTIEKCPVCGMNVTSDYFKTDYKGHTYFFCDDSDQKLFIGDPEKYIGKVKAA